MSEARVQNQITEASKLLDDNGDLVQKGWASSPLLDYNPKAIKLSSWSLVNRMRLKEWDYYGLTGEDFFFSICVSNLGYIGIVFAYHIDFNTKKVTKKVVTRPLGFGCRMPLSSMDGDIHFSTTGVDVDITQTAEGRKVSVDWENFSGWEPLSANFVIENNEDKNAIVMSTPISDKRFYYNHKINCMKTKGVVSVGDDDYQMIIKPGYTTLDWGRGVWEKETFWNWASASGELPDGRVFGMNLGTGFGDLSQASENIFYLDGVAHKLGWLDLQYDKNDYTKPWLFKTDDDRLDLRFEPFVDNASSENKIFVKVEGHQMFGRYFGTLKTDDGETVELDGFIGWAEEHVAEW